MSEQENPVPKPEAPEQLNIKVKDVDGNEVFFKVKRSTKLSKLKRAYAERMGKPENSVRFIFDGQRIGDDDTADSVRARVRGGEADGAAGHERPGRDRRDDRAARRLLSTLLQWYSYSSIAYEHGNGARLLCPAARRRAPACCMVVDCPGGQGGG